MHWELTVVSTLIILFTESTFRGSKNPKCSKSLGQFSAKGSPDGFYLSHSEAGLVTKPSHLRQ